MFWALTGGVVATGLIGTGLSFHQVSILGEQGLSTLEAAANFVPQTMAGLVATLGTGALVDRVRPRVVLPGAIGDPGRGRAPAAGRVARSDGDRLRAALGPAVLRWLLLLPAGVTLLGLTADRPARAGDPTG